MKVVVPAPFAQLASYFCGCGRPETAWQVILDHLENGSLVGDDWDKRTLVLNSGERYVVAYVLTTLGLLEHGGSVDGSWITPAGEQVRDFLREYGVDWIDKDFEFWSERMWLGGASPHG
jgi:hypothetical protein